MGKKSKRNRGASKNQQSARVQQGAVSNTSATTSDVAAAVVGREIEPSTGATSTTTIRRDPIIDSLLDLLKNKDYEGIIKLESDVILRATVLEGTQPQKASYFYFIVAKAFVKSGLSSLIAHEKAIHYFERAFALSEKDMVDDCAGQLVLLYLKERRHDEAFATVKRLTVGIPQHELIKPDLILSIEQAFYRALLNERVIDILTMFLGTINRSWDKENRAKAYLAFGRGYTGLAEYEKADSFLQKALAITDDPEIKVTALCLMGSMSNLSCNYDDALAALNQALEIISAEPEERRNTSKSWSGITALVHAQIGEVLSEQGKRDLEALESFERALVIMKEEDAGGAAKLAATYQEFGDVQARLGNWDEAIDYLKLAYRIVGADPDRRMKSCFPAVLCEEIGRVCLDQYFWDERLLHDTQKRQNVLREATNFSQVSFESSSISLNHAQVAYLMDGIEVANQVLQMYFEGQMKKKAEIYCSSCSRKAGNGTDIKICRNCQVVDYCSEAHQTLAWRRGRLSHKVMCPFLKRYRLVAKAKKQHIDTESYEDIYKDFFETVCVLKYEV
jgi:tetratricopeptide (TPR) repeat protein